MLRFRRRMKFALEMTECVIARSCFVCDAKIGSIVPDFEVVRSVVVEALKRVWLKRMAGQYRTH